MSSDIRPITGKNVVTAGVVVDRFAQVSAVARPTLDAVRQIRDARAWLADQQQRYSSVLINLGIIDESDEDEARARLALIPETVRLQEATRLFDDAVRKSAPEPWYHLMLGTMLASMPNAKNVAPDYQFCVVDTLLHDEESWERGCEPSFSALPSSPARYGSCAERRSSFRSLQKS